MLVCIYTSLFVELKSICQKSRKMSCTFTCSLKGIKVISKFDGRLYMHMHIHVHTYLSQHTPFTEALFRLNCLATSGSTWISLNAFSHMTIEFTNSLSLKLILHKIPRHGSHKQVLIIQKQSSEQTRFARNQAI